MNITIELKRYEELLKKEFVYDAYRKSIKDVKWTSDLEKLLFNIDGITESKEEQANERAYTDTERA